jgi:hypothetical protein
MNVAPVVNQLLLMHVGAGSAFAGSGRESRRMFGALEEGIRVRIARRFLSRWRISALLKGYLKGKNNFPLGTKTTAPATRSRGQQTVMAKNQRHGYWIALA